MAIIRTAMALAFSNLVVATRGQRLGPVGRKVIHRVLTNEAAGLGTKYVNRSTKKGKQKQAAETAGNVVMATNKG